jgi:hypothetical protein
MVTQVAARNACLALGGDMVTYLSFEAQLIVEKYFLKQVPLYSYWWVAGQDTFACAVAGRIDHAY